MSRCVLSLLLVAAAASPLPAEVRSKTISYSDGQTQLEGYFAWDDAVEGKRPGVLVVHEWWGLNDYARRRADQLAKLGYAAFAVDMYGKGKITEHANEAREWASQLRANIKDWQRRAQAGLDVLRRQPQCDTGRIAAIGYCFGGSTVLQLAYSGADLKGVVTFHGALAPPDEEQSEQIKAKILVCHGADDSFIPQEAIDKFAHGLNEAKADWTMVSYSGARHSFTDPGADQHGIEGIKYHKLADERSWRHMQAFFDEIFGKR